MKFKILISFFLLHTYVYEYEDSVSFVGLFGIIQMKIKIITLLMMSVQMINEFWLF